MIYNGHEKGIYANRSLTNQKYRFAPPASGDTMTASFQFGIDSLIYFRIAGSAYRLSTGISKKP